jgi:hypothetical protein
MKKVLLLLTAVLMVPGLAFALNPTIGVFFDTPGQMTYSPTVYVPFNGLLYVHNADYYITAVEYFLSTPDDPTHALVYLTGTSYPDNFAVELGDPFDLTIGHSISYWPPLNGTTPGYNLLATYEFLMIEPCWDAGGGIMNYRLVIVQNPGSGFLRGTSFPDNLPFDMTGLTSYLCPFEIGVEEESWGAIKSLYK